MKRWLVASTLIVVLSGPTTRAWADSESGVDGSELVIATPSLIMAAFNGATLLVDEGSTFVGVLGIVTGTFTAFFGAIFLEPVVMTAGAVSLVTGYYSARRASEKRYPTFDLVVAPGSYRVCLSVPF
jgi:hypothetical protein